MITMQKPWRTPGGIGTPPTSAATLENSSKDEFDTNTFIDMGKNKIDNETFGLMMERSISAPPAGSFNFEKDNFLLGNIDSVSRGILQQQTSNDDYQISSATWHNSSTTRSIGLFDNLKDKGSNSQRESSPISDIRLSSQMTNNSRQQLSSASTDINRHQIGRQQQQLSTDNNHIGSFIDRPQSAAPNFSGNKLGHHAPPGLGHDIADNANLNIFNSEDIMKIGSRRPASTGVIGQVSNTSSSVMESLGLMSSTKHATLSNKTLMDLIQEDFPKTPSPEFNLNSEETFQEDHTHQIHKTNGYTPASTNNSTLNGVTSEQNNATSFYHINSTGGIHKAPNYRTMSQGMENTPFGVKSSMTPVNNDIPSGMRHTPTQDQHMMRQQINHNSQYAPYMPQSTNNSISPRSGHSVPHPHQVVYNSRPHVHMDHPSVPNAHISNHNHHVVHQQPMYYATQQYNGSAVPEVPVPAQVLHSHAGGVPVFMTPTPFGYATVQYHTGPPPPHHLSNQVLHAHNPTIIPQTQHPHEFVSTLPVHGSAPRPSPELGSNGGYVYYQPTTLPSPHGTTHPTLTLVNAHGQPTTIAVAPVTASTQNTVPLSPAPPTRNTRLKNGASTNGKISIEKGTAKNKKNSSINLRRGGTNGSSISLDQSKASSCTSAGSSLLEEFRCAKNRSWSINDIQGHVVEFCQDQNGSRFIQQRLETAKVAEKELVMAEVLPCIRRLRNDVFGNYVVQKLLENGSESMKEELKKTLQSEMLSLSMQMYGCRVVQKALEKLSDEDIPRLLEEFHGHVLTCIHDQNGNHVIQKCVEVLSSKAKRASANGDETKANIFSEQVRFIIDNVLESVAPLSCHPYGCRVLQRVLEHCVESQKLRTLDEIMKFHRTLLDDQYGNYVIQHVLQYGRVSDRDSILGIVIENGLLNLSRQKYASNVVEKLLKFGTKNQRNAIVREMLKIVNEDDEDTSVVLLMVRDAYANYVVQTSLDVVAEGEERSLLLEELNRHASLLRNFTFAKHIVTKLGH